MNNKCSLIFTVFISIFFIIIASIWLKYTFLSQQKTLSELDNINQNYEDIISDLENIINELSRDNRIIEIAIKKLNMKFPKPDDIICVQKSRIAKGDFCYTFQSFLSPEAIAADK
ncbi:MAG: cell division protein FtsL [Candidatus Cloacimonetes bacterium]|nr:cell division protein FtsL [Candidatus Cloacimonadota bacterium]